jgi:hypothetical protein
MFRKSVIIWDERVGPVKTNVLEGSVAIEGLHPRLGPHMRKQYVAPVIKSSSTSPFPQLHWSSF